MLYVVERKEEMELNELEALDKWKQALRQTCIAYCSADDSVKELNRELKPMRQTVKECSQRVMDLLDERQERRCDIHDHSVSLKMDTRKSKKMPTKQQLKDRCIEYSASEDRGDELFTFLTTPIVTERTRLLRKKLAVAKEGPAFIESVHNSVAEMLEDLEPQD